MTMENQPFEDVSPTKNGDFPLQSAMFVFRGFRGWFFPRFTFKIDPR